MDILITCFLILLASIYFNNWVCSQYKLIQSQFLWLLWGFHFAISCVYFAYAAATSSDSVSYYNHALGSGEWLPLLGTGTTFIHFLAWPFTGMMGLSYYAVMLIFSFFGYCGILLFYLVLAENVPDVFSGNSGSKVIADVLFLLPNLHFWSSSLGKGSMIILALGLFTYGLSRFNRRTIFMIMGATLIFFIRPHIVALLFVSILAGLIFTTKGIKPVLKWGLIVFFTGTLFWVYGSILKTVELDTLNIADSEVLGHRAQELAKATSGIDISQYNWMMRFVTFCFRPLFPFDQMGIMGLLASIENYFYLFLVLYMFRYMFYYWSQINGLFKICLFFFLFTSIALSQVTGNLGIAMRQKAQVMPFIFIFYCKIVQLVRMENFRISPKLN